VRRVVDKHPVYTLSTSFVFFVLSRNIDLPLILPRNLTIIGSGAKSFAEVKHGTRKVGRLCITDRK
jgi:hypothetical protein